MARALADSVLAPPTSHRSSAQVVEDIKPLYAIERKLREGKAPPGEILQTRREKAAQIVENLFKKLQDKLADTANSPLNKLRDAIDYALKRRDTLQSWLANPCLPIDNNTVERAVRPVTVGRKNYLFIGAPEAGQRAAILYTMLVECKRCGARSPGSRTCCASCPHTAARITPPCCPAAYPYRKLHPPRSAACRPHTHTTSVYKAAGLMLTLKP